MKFKLSALIGCLVFCTVSLFAFDSKVAKTNDEGKLAFEQVVEVPNVSKAVLYKNAKTWILENVKTGDNNIQFDDAANETIITTPTLALPDLKHNHATNQKIMFKLKLSFKEGKYKIDASSFTYFGKDINEAWHLNEPLETLKIKRIIPDPVKKIEPLFDEAFQNFLNALMKAIESKQQDW